MNELEKLLDHVEPPATAVADDVARGERALGRRRRWRAASVGVAALAVAAGAVGVQSVHRGPAETAGYAATAGSGPSAEQADSADGGAADPQQTMNQINDLVARYGDVLRERLQLSPQEKKNFSPQPAAGDYDAAGYFGVSQAMLSKEGFTFVTAVVGTSWDQLADIDPGLDRSSLSSTTFQGQDALVSTGQPDLFVSLKRDDGTVVSMFATNSVAGSPHTPVTAVTEQQLLEIATDERLVLPDPMPGAVSESERMQLSASASGLGSGQ